MKIPWKDEKEGAPVPEEQYQERFWRRRLDGIGLDTINKELLAIEFKRTQDTRSNYAEKATAVAQEQYTSLLAGLHAVGQIKGWKVQQLVFVGGTCGSAKGGGGSGQGSGTCQVGHICLKGKRRVYVDPI
jgi:hypothetical protein